MKLKRLLILLGVGLLIAVGAAATPFLRLSPVQGETNIFASPVQAGCYIAAPNDCRIHVEPFTINIATGKKLVFFQLVTVQTPGGVQTMIHDFRTDLSNPVPFVGTTYTPNLVAQDYAASCGKSYQLSLQGQDSGDANAFNLGLTAAFTCPSRVP